MKPKDGNDKLLLLKELLRLNDPFPGNGKPHEKNQLRLSLSQLNRKLHEVRTVRIAVLHA